MPTSNDFDTGFAKTVSQMMATTLSSYSSAGNALLGNLNIIPYIYGKEHITRPIADPYDDVMIDRRFNAPEQQMEKRIQDIDFVCVSKRLMVDSVDYAGDTANAQKHVADGLNIVRDGIEKYWIEGSSTRILMYGLADYPTGTAGTINRPEAAYAQATTGVWETFTNMQADVIEAIGGLISMGFHGPFKMLAPDICIPMFATVMTNTAVPVNTWVSSALGLPVIFSPYVDADATRDVFDCYIIDSSKVHIGMTDLKIDSYYSNKDHAYFWDFECFMGALFDPIFHVTAGETSGEWLKGVSRLAARDWTS